MAPVLSTKQTFRLRFALLTLLLAFCVALVPYSNHLWVWFVPKEKPDYIPGPPPGFTLEILPTDTEERKAAKASLRGDRNAELNYFRKVFYENPTNPHKFDFANALRRSGKSEEALKLYRELAVPGTGFERSSTNLISVLEEKLKAEPPSTKGQ